LELTTPGGYKCGEVASALQKCIRRGLADDALFWATELDLASYGEYVRKRVRIIASEDVGLADNSACLTILTLYQSWQLQRKKKTPDTRPSASSSSTPCYSSPAAGNPAWSIKLIIMYEAPAGCARDSRLRPRFGTPRAVQAAAGLEALLGRRADADRTREH
jgi:hypothetical protein